MLRTVANEARWGGHAWIRQVSAAHSEAAVLASAATPLTELTYATIDNIDAADLPTTGACTAFVSKPTVDATAVNRVRPADASLLVQTAPTHFTVAHMRADLVRLNPHLGHHNHFTSPSASVSPPKSGRCH